MKYKVDTLESQVWKDRNIEQIVGFNIQYSLHILFMEEELGIGIRGW